MKTTIIVILLVILTGAAFVSRPSKVSFKSLVQDRISREADGFAGKFLAAPAAEWYVSQVEFEDHYLWTSVKKDGKTVYLGAFGRWFPKHEGERLIHEVVQGAGQKVGV